MTREKFTRAFLLLCMLQMGVYAHAAETLPPAVRGFCELAFAGKIAMPDQKFNPTDVVEKGVPSRRILGYLVGKRYAYLWYEHGGRSYHQHLVKFSSSKPYEVKASYVFDGTQHKDIHQLIKDRKFLALHARNQCGL